MSRVCIRKRRGASGALRCAAYRSFGEEEEEVIEDEEERDPVYINVYLEDLAYGGPEEGGWYYRAGVPVHSEYAGHLSLEKRRKRLAHLMRDVYSNEGRRPISSVLSEGEYWGRLEPDFAEPFPKRRPHYE